MEPLSIAVSVSAAGDRFIIYNLDRGLGMLYLV